MNRFSLSSNLVSWFLLVIVSSPITSLIAQEAPAHSSYEYDVVIVGGSTAALAAAVSSAESGVRTALLEPTDWIGGQLTSSAVPAIDEAWHKVVDEETGELVVNVSKLARDPRNMSPLLRDMLHETGNPGQGWVSRYCFEPRRFLANHLQPLADKAKPTLDIFYECVPKSCRIDEKDRRIVELTAIERSPVSSGEFAGYERFLSQDLEDWYSSKASPRFEKRRLTFQAKVFVDASEWGELLALSSADYAIGVEDSPSGSSPCGQAITYCFVQRMSDKKESQVIEHEPIGELGYGPYSNREDAWQKIWTYRRIRGQGATASVGELSLQNWGYSDKEKSGGNDYPFGYLFLSRNETADQIEDWKGGVDAEVLHAAEQRALAWHNWFKKKTPAPLSPEQLVLDLSALGTGHGLSKVPYIRDTRRSIGLDGFLLNFEDLVSKNGSTRGTRFDDRIAIGAYAADIHPLVCCNYPDFVYVEQKTAPFYIPFRALTNRTHSNLLVAGKTMAQDFMANSATRLHPIEWSSGIACGVAAATMVEKEWTSGQAYSNIELVQKRVAKQTPIEWTE